MKTHIKEEHEEYLNNWTSIRNELQIYLTMKYKDLFIVYLKNERYVQKAATIKVGFSDEEADNFKFVLNYDNEKDNGYEITVGGPCIPKCNINQIFNSEFVSIPRGLLGKVHYNNFGVIDVSIKKMYD